jgi:hypothetical protein
VLAAAQTLGGTGSGNPLAGDGFGALGSPISHRGDWGAVWHSEPESGGENSGRGVRREGIGLKNAGSQTP